MNGLLEVQTTADDGMPIPKRTAMEGKESRVSLWDVLRFCVQSADESLFLVRRTLGESELDPVGANVENLLVRTELELDTRIQSMAGQLVDLDETGSIRCDDPSKKAKSGFGDSLIPRAKIRTHEPTLGDNISQHLLQRRQCLENSDNRQCFICRLHIVKVLIVQDHRSLRHDLSWRRHTGRQWCRRSLSRPFLKVRRRGSCLLLNSHAQGER